VTSQDPSDDQDGRRREPGHCLDEQTLLDLAAGRLPARGRSEVERHLAGCDDCAELVMLAAPTGVDPASCSTARLATSRTRHVSALLRPGTALNDTYRIVRFIGEGGMGEVYEVSHSRLSGRYAAKVLSLDLAKNAQAFSRFRREAQIASGLSHPNIVQVIDFSEPADGRPFLVMEFLDGHDLSQILSEGPLPLARTMHLVEQIVSALAVLHGHRIVHRDLKPQNIFVLAGKDGDSEHVKLVDFGLAKRASASMAVTQERLLLGTPQYMAPEQAVGKADGLGPEADQFALAALIYEMLGGKPAFEGDTLSAVLYRIVHEMPRPLRELAPDVPVHVCAALERGLAKAPEARFASIKAFFNELQSRSPARIEELHGESTAPHRRRARARWVAGSVAALVAIAASAILRAHVHDPPNRGRPAAGMSDRADLTRDPALLSPRDSAETPARTSTDLANHAASTSVLATEPPRGPADQQRTAGAPQRLRGRSRPKASVARPVQEQSSRGETTQPAENAPTQDDDHPLIDTL
jgi:serine/threonine protein kinase